MSNGHQTMKYILGPVERRIRLVKGNRPDQTEINSDHVIFFAKLDQSGATRPFFVDGSGQVYNMGAFYAFEDTTSAIWITYGGFYFFELSDINIFIQSHYERPINLKFCGASTRTRATITSTSDDKLKINTDSQYGPGALYLNDIAAGSVSIAAGGGNVMIGTTQTPATGSYTLVIKQQASNPTGMPADTAGLFVKDVAGTAELFAIDEAGNAVQLSKHPSDILNTVDPSIPYPMVLTAENEYLGKKVVIDITSLALELEKLTGKKFVNFIDIGKRSWRNDKIQSVKEQLKEDRANWIEITEDEAVEEVVEEVDDTENIIGYESPFVFEDGEVKRIKRPVYAKKQVKRKAIKANCYLCEKTGKFLRKPTDLEIESKLSAVQIKEPPEWMKIRGVS